MRQLGAVLFVFFIYIPSLILIAIALRKTVHHFSFYGMSKAREKKIITEQNIVTKLLMMYAWKYNNVGMSCWCLLWYYVYVVSAIVGSLFLCLEILFEFNLDAPILAEIFGYGFQLSIFIPLLSLLIKAKNKNAKD